MNRLGIDPGDIHVGWCRGSSLDDVETGEWTPEECCEVLIHWMTLGMVDEVIIEEFALYPDEFKSQTWSPMRTSQLIGAIKLICRMFRVPWVEQGAYIKKPTRAQLRARGIKHEGPSIHARDAELHYYYRTLRAMQEEH